MNILNNITMTTDYLKQKGFSENGEVKMSFQDLENLLTDFKEYIAFKESVKIYKSYVGSSISTEKRMKRINDFRCGM